MDMNVEKDKKKSDIFLDDLAFLEGYIKDLFSFLPLPVCLVSSLGVILDSNPAFEKISGYSLTEVIGHSTEDFFVKEEINELSCETIGKGFVKGKEISLLARDKRKVPVSAATILRKSDQGEIIGYFISFFDLSDIKKYEKELQEAKMVLEIRVTELEKFQKLIIGRELKMVELKEENEKLKEELERHKSGA